MLDYQNNNFLKSDKVASQLKAPGDFIGLGFDRFNSFGVGLGLGLAEVWRRMWIRIIRDQDGPRYELKVLQKLKRVKRYLQKKIDVIRDRFS